MKLLSWNINGIRAVHNKNLILPLLDEEMPDIVGLQEVKAKADQNPITEALIERGYSVLWNGAERPGYSGTAIFSRVPFLSSMTGMNGHMEDLEGRIATIETEHFYFITVYTPNSKTELERLDYRQTWDKQFLKFLKELEKTKPVIVCGDLNVAHQDIDLEHPKANTRSAGFTDEEREGIRNFLWAGFIDTFRYFFPDTTKAYTWWSNFSWARSRNVGWRIDYFLASKSLEAQLVNAAILHQRMGSDHCPVVLELSIES